MTLCNTFGSYLKINLAEKRNYAFKSKFDFYTGPYPNKLIKIWRYKIRVHFPKRHFAKIHFEKYTLENIFWKNTLRMRHHVVAKFACNSGGNILPHNFVKEIFLCQGLKISQTNHFFCLMKETYFFKILFAPFHNLDVCQLCYVSPLMRRFIGCCTHKKASFGKQNPLRTH